MSDLKVKGTLGSIYSQRKTYLTVTYTNVIYEYVLDACLKYSMLENELRILQIKLHHTVFMIHMKTNMNLFEKYVIPFLRIIKSIKRNFPSKFHYEDKTSLISSVQVCILKGLENIFI